MPRPPRHARPADIDGLVALENATFASDRISRRQWRHHVASDTASVLVCAAAGHVRGAAVVLYRRRARVARLYSLAVRADARGRGLGGALLAAAEADARRRGCAVMSLEVYVGNRAAIGLYERSGYVTVTRLRRYYKDGADGWRLRKSLRRPDSCHPLRR